MTKLLVVTVLVALLALSKCILRPWHVLMNMINQWWITCVVWLITRGNLWPPWPGVCRRWKLPYAEGRRGGAGHADQDIRLHQVLLWQRRQHGQWIPGGHQGHEAGGEGSVRDFNHRFIDALLKRVNSCMKLMSSFVSPTQEPLHRYHHSREHLRWHCTRSVVSPLLPELNKNWSPMTSSTFSDKNFQAPHGEAHFLTFWTCYFTSSKP